MQQQKGCVALIEKAKRNIQECNVFHIKNLLDEGKLDGILIDVRELSEYTNAHLPGAHHLSRGIIEFQIESLVPNKEQKLYLYCGIGYRSALSAENLQEMGYQNVISIDGGFSAWAKNGFPITTEAQ